MQTNPPDISLLWFIPIAIILLAQGLWIFQDAKKRGMNHWLWGLLGLLNVPTSLIVYLLVSRTYRKNS